ncbi:hypothetical protein JOM56_002088 [Amanita muscaria]
MVSLAQMQSALSRGITPLEQAAEDAAHDDMIDDGGGVAASIHAPSRPASRASKRARTESEDTDSDMETEEPAKHPVLSKFITWLDRHVVANPESGATLIESLYAALDDIITEAAARDDQTIRRPLKTTPKTTPKKPSQGSSTQAPQAPRPPRAPEATSATTPKPPTFAAVAATHKKHIPKDDLPNIIHKVQQLRKDFPSITEAEAIRYASQTPAGQNQRTPDTTKQRRSGSAVIQGTKSNILLLKPVKPEEFTKTPEQIRADIAHPLVKEVRIGRTGTFIVSSERPLTKEDHSDIKASISNACGVAADHLAVTNKDTLSHVKFLGVPRLRANGDQLEPEHIMLDLRQHPAWVDAPISGAPILIPPKGPNQSFVTILVKIHDTRGGAWVKALSKTMVIINDEYRRCKVWQNFPSIPRCTHCQMWGHSSYICRNTLPVCATCGANHPTSRHSMHCAQTQCSTDKSCKCGIEYCCNCGKKHQADSADCGLFKKRFDKEAMRELIRAQAQHKITRKNKATKGRVPRVHEESRNRFSNLTHD